MDLHKYVRTTILGQAKYLTFCHNWKIAFLITKTYLLAGCRFCYFSFYHVWPSLCLTFSRCFPWQNCCPNCHHSLSRLLYYACPGSPNPTAPFQFYSKRYCKDVYFFFSSLSFLLQHLISLWAPPLSPGLSFPVMCYTYWTMKEHRNFAHNYIKTKYRKENRITEFRGLLSLFLYTSVPCIVESNIQTLQTGCNT